MSDPPMSRWRVLTPLEWLRVALCGLFWLGLIGAGVLVHPALGALGLSVGALAVLLLTMGTP
jgi:hypothetical protein